MFNVHMQKDFPQWPHNHEDKSQQSYDLLLKRFKERKVRNDCHESCPKQRAFGIQPLKQPSGGVYVNAHHDCIACA
eukprot:1249768-Amphidinium_carterae.1